MTGPSGTRWGAGEGTGDHWKCKRDVRRRTPGMKEALKEKGQTKRRK
jgi:hypothetical protein